MSNLIGQRLGQYEIIGLLGKGGMATVYRAKQMSVEREVAVKVIDPGLAETSDFVRRFEREAKIVAALSHLHILKVFDYGQQDDYVYIVMEILDGGSLADMIQRGPLSVEATVRLIDQIASALDYAHRHGILHRDLKPQNILLDSDGNAHLSDFGIAKLSIETTRLTRGGMAMGTPPYMSPEQFQDLPLDNRVDVYALGIMLFEMLTGKLPFTAKTPAEMGFKHLQVPPPPIRDLRPDLPAGVENVIAKALAKNRDERFSTAGELSAEFRGALGIPVGIDSSASFRAVKPAITSESVPPPTAPPDSMPPVPVPAPGEGRRARPFVIGTILILLIAAGITFAALFAIVIRPSATATPTPTETKAQIIDLPTVELPTASPSATTVPPTATPTIRASPTPSATPTSTATFTETLTASATSTPTQPPTELPNPPAETVSPTAVSPSTEAAITPSAAITSTYTLEEGETATAIAGDLKTAIAVAPFGKTPSPSANVAETSTPFASKGFAGTPDEIISQLVYQGLLMSSDGSLVYQKDSVDLPVTSSGTTKIRTIVSGVNVRDFVISADVTWDAPDEANACGFFFRYTVDSTQTSNYYAADITRQGTFQAISHDNDSDQTLKENSSSTINTGDGDHNQILLIAEGDTFRFFVNGQLVETFQDSSFTSGNLGVVASRLSDSTGLTCHFSNLFAYELKTGLETSLLSDSPDDIIQSLLDANVVSGTPTRVSLSKPTGNLTTAPNTFSATAAESAKLTDMVLSTDVTFASSEPNNLYCGVFYNGTFPQINAISLFFSRSKKLYVYISKNSSFKDTTPILAGVNTPAINNGDVNRVTLVVANNAATLFINGKQAQTWTDTTYKSGQVGYFIVNTSTDPDLECDFANTVVWSLK